MVHNLRYLNDILNEFFQEIISQGFDTYELQILEY